MRNRFHYVHITIVFTLSIFAAICYSSCIKDNCTGTVCRNSGVCVEGVCACAPGYFGDQCENTWSGRFLGTWKVRDTIVKKSGTVKNYTIQITNSNSLLPYTFVADGFAGFVDSMAAARKTHIEFAFNDRQVDSIININTATGKLDTLTNTLTAYYTIRYKDSSVNHFIQCTR